MLCPQHTLVLSESCREQHSYVIHAALRALLFAPYSKAKPHKPTAHITLSCHRNQSREPFDYSNLHLALLKDVSVQVPSLRLSPRVFPWFPSLLGLAHYGAKCCTGHETGHDRPCKAFQPCKQCSEHHPCSTHTALAFFRQHCLAKVMPRTKMQSLVITRGAQYRTTW